MTSALNKNFSFTTEEKKILKEYSEVCLRLHEYKERMNVMKRAKKMFEEEGLNNGPSVVSILKKLDNNQSVLIKDAGVELKNVKRVRQVPLSKKEMHERLNLLLDPEAASVVFTNLTDKKYKQKVEKQSIVWSLIDADDD